MLTDYKFRYIKRDDDGFITEAAVRFYEGEIKAEFEYDPILRKDISIKRYRRMDRLFKKDLEHLKSKDFLKEENGTDSVLYDKNDFGNIKTDEELRLFINMELVKDTKREPILEQK